MKKNIIISYLLLVTFAGSLFANEVLKISSKGLSCETHLMISHRCLAKCNLYLLKD